MAELILNSLNEIGIDSTKMGFQSYEYTMMGIQCQESLREHKQNC